MKELNSLEIEQVSGAGIFADIGGGIGGAIGSIVDAGTSLGGLNTNAHAAAETLGKGIGNIFELNVFGAISNIGAGVVGIVGFGIDAIAQIIGKKHK
ncbi:hypothetical protein ACGVWS_00760 [Enterobacteriaceae bacterium LUAb1]